ncbi:MAG: lipoate--protein ligase [Syntrophomonadaceae bacterium]|nr:lipoate--protein ligase [Syntrophomonadaceae bacterium]
MLEIINNCNDPYFNLALEEYVVKNIDISSLFIIWQNSPTVVIGKNQNALEEVNMEFIRQEQINLVRRISGGGAVYHDFGNINFTFVAEAGKGVVFDFERFTQPIIKTLDKIGIKAEHNGRNDITIDGRKFSGNAQFRYGNRVMHHGTLLYNVNLENMAQALNVSEEKMISKGVKSVKSRVTNISEHLATELTVEEFKELLVKNLKSEANIVDTYELTPDDLVKINELCNTKYRTWDWNIGKSPDYNVRKQKRFAWGSIEVLLKLDQGMINNCKIFGDFFAAQDIDLLENEFKGLPYEKKAIESLLDKINIADYLPNTNNTEILELIFAEE